jgi:integrase/recombinase XerD
MAQRQRGLTAAGLNMYARTINSYLTWLHEEGYLQERLRVKLLPNPAKPLTTFSDADVRRILAFRPKGRTQTRTWTLIVILFDIGVRIDEALGLEREKVDLDGLTLTVTGKGHRQRIVPISIQGRKALYRLMAKTASDSTYVFRTASGQRLSYRNAYRDIKTLCHNAGVIGPYVHPHNIRHFFAVTYIRRGGDLYRLSRILGHSSINTTAIYLRSMGIEHLQEGHGRFSPLARASA